jgi:predicted transcriptional regulator of viral defense system
MRRPQPATIDVLSELASEQDGYLTTGQARAIGVSVERLVRLRAEGFLERVLHGVYHIAVGTQMPSRVPEHLYVRYLALDSRRLPWHRSAPAVVVSHESAAEILGLGTLPADIATFTSATRRTTTVPATRIRTAPLAPEDWIWAVDGRLPVTTAARTAIDLALTGVGRDFVQRILREALGRQMASVDQLRDVLDARRRNARRASVGWLDRYLDSVRDPDGS